MRQYPTWTWPAIRAALHFLRAQPELTGPVCAVMETRNTHTERWNNPAPFRIIQNVMTSDYRLALPGEISLMRVRGQSSILGHEHTSVAQAYVFSCADSLINELTEGDPEPCPFRLPVQSLNWEWSETLPELNPGHYSNDPKIQLKTVMIEAYNLLESLLQLAVLSAHHPAYATLGGKLVAPRLQRPGLNVALELGALMPPLIPLPGPTTEQPPVRGISAVVTEPRLILAAQWNHHQIILTGEDTP